MSRYRSGDYEYGYDNPLHEYFLQKVIHDEYDFPEIVELVGNLSDTYGSAVNLLTALKNHNVQIPEEHELKLIGDLPI
jgi:hypothetical protein